ncbi:hypothetical protein ES703_26643 [subsurface metagenome]
MQKLRVLINIIVQHLAAATRVDMQHRGKTSKLLLPTSKKGREIIFLLGAVSSIIAFSMDTLPAKSIVVPGASRAYQDRQVIRSPLFTIASDFQRDLADSHVSGRLRDEFKDNGILLPAGATIRLSRERTGWEVMDAKNRRTYLIRKEDGKLAVYSAPNTHGGLFGRDEDVTEPLISAWLFLFLVIAISLFITIAIDHVITKYTGRSNNHA